MGDTNMDNEGRLPPLALTALPAHLTPTSAPVLSTAARDFVPTTRKEVRQHYRVHSRQKAADKKKQWVDQRVQEMKVDSLAEALKGLGGLGGRPLKADGPVDAFGGISSMLEDRTSRFKKPVDVKEQLHIEAVREYKMLSKYDLLSQKPTAHSSVEHGRVVKSRSQVRVHETVWRDQTAAAQRRGLTLKDYLLRKMRMRNSRNERKAKKNRYNKVKGGMIGFKKKQTGEEKQERLKKELDDEMQGLEEESAAMEKGVSVHLRGRPRPRWCPGLDDVKEVGGLSLGTGGFGDAMDTE